MTIQRFSRELTEVWNELIHDSRNGTFLFDRSFMDYHSDRFSDISLLFYSRGKLLGVLPASLHGDEVRSHGGLTYGGFIVSKQAHAADVGEMLELAKAYYAAQGIKRMLIKPVPYIYHSYPADDEIYWFFRHGARLVGRGLSTAINLREPLPFSTLRKRKINSAERSGLYVSATEDDADYVSFHAILTQVLATQHNRTPVHTVAELILLRKRFPKNMRLFVVRSRNRNEMLGGTLVFACGKVLHAQYIAANDEGKDLGALDLLFKHIVDEETKNGFECLDFGISTEDNGNYLNEGLNFQKEGFGGRSIVYDSYLIDL